MNALFPLPSIDAAAQETAERIAEQRRGDIERGADCLVAEPRRVDRIIPYGTNMDFGSLAIELARRLRNAPPERRVGFLQLRAAFSRKAFRDAWIAMREVE